MGRGADSARIQSRARGGLLPQAGSRPGGDAVAPRRRRVRAGEPDADSQAVRPCRTLRPAQVLLIRGPGRFLAGDRGPSARRRSTPVAVVLSRTARDGPARGP